MFDVDSLPLKHWAKTISIDNDIVDELERSRITAMFPKRVIKFEDWIITKINIYTTSLKKKAVIFTAEAKINGKSYTQRIRIYSPHFPRVKRLEQYLGSRIAGGNFLCSIRANSQDVLIARYIQVIKKDGLKSNPIMSLEPRNKKLLEKNKIIQLDEYEEMGDALTSEEFIKTYFNDRKVDELLVN